MGRNAIRLTVNTFLIYLHPCTLMRKIYTGFVTYYSLLFFYLNHTSVTY